mgnify:CR=1 FL=1
MIDLCRSYLFLLDFVSLMLNDTLDTDKIVVVNEVLFAIFLFFFLLFGVIEILTILDLLLSLWVGGRRLLLLWLFLCCCGLI